jgi:hypothetical protein
MFDSHADLAALVYANDQRPDDILRSFAMEVRARGHRVTGLVQLDGHCSDGQLAVMVLHTGERIGLLENRGTGAKGCRLDVQRLLNAGSKVADAIGDGADLVVINRFGKQEQGGKGLRFLIEQALGAEIPVVVAVAQSAFPAWTQFSDGMSVKLACNTRALRAWWQSVSGQVHIPVIARAESMCDAVK